MMHVKTLAFFIAGVIYLYLSVLIGGSLSFFCVFMFAVCIASIYSCIGFIKEEKYETKKSLVS